MNHLESQENPFRITCDMNVMSLLESGEWRYIKATNNTHTHREPVWPSGKRVRLVSGGTSVRIRFGSPFSSKGVVCGHCLVALSLTIMKH